MYASMGIRIIWHVISYKNLYNYHIKALMQHINVFLVLFQNQEGQLDPSSYKSEKCSKNVLVISLLYLWLPITYYTLMNRYKQHNNCSLAY